MPMKVIRANLADHSAVRTWRRLAEGRAEPDSIQILKEDVHGKRCGLDLFPPEETSSYSVLELPSSRSAVYRLVDVGLRGSAVVAKQCYHQQSESAATEHIIYERVLSRLPISALRYYGLVADDTECR
jgi:hypothetical protein